MGQRRRIIWADKARTDRKQILHYWRIDRQNREYAYRLEGKFRSAVLMLAESPKLGKYSVRFPGVLRWNFGHWMIYYKATEPSLYIARLLGYAQKSASASPLN